jgi:hypothetical protein
VDAEARADITTLETSLAENTQHIKDFTINVNDKQFGAKGDGVTDDTLAIQTAIDTLYAARNTVAHRTILFPSTRYKISSTLQINMAGVKFVGGGFLRPDVEGTGTRLELNTSANNGSTPIPLIQIGTNNGNPYDNADYSGYEGFSIENMLLRYYGGSRTALLNGQASSWSYGTNTYGIRDWKGGAISLKNVRIEGFEYGFWGIQSDINQWDNVYLWYNKLGAYLGPRSDQNTFTHVYTKFNDTGIHIDRSANARFFGCHFVDDGSATTPAIKIGSSYASSGSGAIAFHGCWFEHFMGADEIEAFVDIASSDTVQTLDVWFRDSIILTNDQVTAIHAKYFLKIGNATRIIVDGLNGNLNKLSKLFSFVGSTSPAVRVSLHDDQISNLFVNNGTGTPSINNWGWGYNSNKLSSQNGRLYLQRTTPNNQRDFFVSAESDKTFCVDFSSDGTGNTRRVSLERRLVGKYGAAPTTGTWDIGDIALNSNSQPGTPAAWQCTASSPLTFMPIAQAGYRTTTAAPTLTPNFIGEEVLDTTNKNWYKSVGTNSTDWKLMT